MQSSVAWHIAKALKNGSIDKEFAVRHQPIVRYIEFVVTKVIVGYPWPQVLAKNTLLNLMERVGTESFIDTEEKPE